jgi:cyclomaltodextrinase
LSYEASLRQFPKGTLHLRISDDHDEARAIARYGMKGALAASVFLFSMDGVPLLYNGMEVGDATESGDPALFEKMPVFWSSKDRPPYREIYRGLLGLRRSHPAFRTGKLQWLQNSTPNDVVSLMRSDDTDEFVVLVNFANRPVSGSVEIPDAAGFKPVTPGVRNTPGGFPRYNLRSYEYRIYRKAKG